MSIKDKGIEAKSLSILERILIAIGFPIMMMLFIFCMPIYMIVAEIQIILGIFFPKVFY